MISESYLAACRFDIIAPKPGNVSIAQPGHDMIAEQFLSAARASLPSLLAEKSVGAAILGAVQASVAVTHCNTNLGILLLSAPIIVAAKEKSNNKLLRDGVANTLDRLSVDDCRLAFTAIQVAEPGGLGASDAHDVEDAPTVDLKEAMTYAAERDRIAWQYAHEFVDVFTVGVPIIDHYVQRWQSLKWATVACYLSFLGAFNDTHIERKFGAAVASGVVEEALMLERVIKACENPADLAPTLSQFDAKLKRRGVNPGTSADLTVASLLAYLLQAYL